jgi:cyclophilin family peptidyl-prolyl cis-trans isomerase
VRCANLKQENSIVKKTAKLFLLIAGLSCASFGSNPEVKLVTSYGDIVLRLDSTAAPKTVANFLDYVNSKFYDGTIFHRVIANFMIQGGGMTPDMTEKATKHSIVNEADNGLKNVRRTVAMARRPDPNSASSQFFINLKDNPALDYKSKTSSGWGYCVFGRVIQGMSVVDSIAKVQTTSVGMNQDVPVKPVIIKSAVVMPPVAESK